MTRIIFGTLEDVKNHFTLLWLYDKKKYGNNNIQNIIYKKKLVNIFMTRSYN